MSETPPAFALPQYEGEILATMNPDGSRRWLSPRVVKGARWKTRAVVAWALIAIFTLLPWLRFDGLPMVQLDVVSRQFTFWGTVFRPTDTLLLALLLLAVFTGIFLLTAILGRVWCGWACPQTVYMEFVYRPIERLFLGRGYGRRGVEVPVWRRVAMYAVFLLLSAHLANTFLAYFVGTDNLVLWTLGSPADHPVAFMVFAVTTGLMMFDFCFFREQLCTLVCPYGRFQSVLLDRDSLIVGYDRARGEPRGRMLRASGGRPAGGEPAAIAGEAAPGAPAAEPPRLGDCIDCHLCVAVCPTGIDIRNGLQLECLHCTACMDACDSVMAKIGRAPGLVRYGSQNAFEGTPARRFRFRLLVYPLLLAVVLTAFLTLLVTRQDAMVVQLRSPGETHRVLEDGRIESPLRMRIDNRTREPRAYTVVAVDPAVELRGPERIEIAPVRSAEVEFRVRSRPESFSQGRRMIEIRVADEHRFDRIETVRVLGPFAGPARRGGSP